MMKKTKKMNNNIFIADRINWISLAAGVIIIYGSIGLVVIVLLGETLTLKNILILLMILIVIVVINYYNHILEIEFSESEIKIKSTRGQYTDYRRNFYTIERQKSSGPFHRYWQLVVINKKLNRKFKINSDDWSQYADIKDAFLNEEKGIKNE